MRLETSDITDTRRQMAGALPAAPRARGVAPPDIAPPDGAPPDARPKADAPAASRRVETIDMWRGLVLVVIFINHVPGNLLEHLTMKNFGFSDSAEAFVFVSGLAVALAYFPKLNAGDWLGTARRCVKRALKLYGVHLLLTLAALVMFGQGWDEQRYRFDKDGRLQPNWTPPCTQ